MNNRIAKIIEKVFLASIRNAKLEPDYDSISVDKNQGIFIELDGTLDYDSIDKAFDSEKQNLKAIADDISKQLIEDNKEYMEQTFGMDVESIDSSKYKIIHDDKKNRLFLFLPASAVNTKKQQAEEEAIGKESERRDIDIIDKTIVALGKFVKSNNVSSRMSGSRENETASIIAKTATASDSFDEYTVDVKIERVSGKKNDIFETNLYLKIKYQNETIYDKFVRNMLKFSKFNLQMPETKGDMIVFQIPQDKDGRRDFFANAEKFLNEVTKKDNGSIAAFKKDLNSEKVQEKLSQQIADLYGEYDYGDQMR